jgi:exonuclease SbcC
LQGIDIEGLKADKCKLEKDFIKLQSEISKWENECRDADSRLTDTKEEKGRVEAKIASLNSELALDKLQLGEIKLELQRYKENFEAEAKNYDQFRNETGILDFSEELKTVNEKARKEEVLRKKQTELLDRIKQFDDEIKSLNDKINSEKLELAKILESGRMMRSEIEKRKDARNKYYDRDDPSEYLVQTKELIKNIQDNEASLKRKLEMEKKSYQEKTEDKVKEDENLKGLKQLAADQDRRLNEVMLEKGFEAAREVAAAILQNDDMLKLENEIEKYSNAMINTRDNIVRIEKKLNGETVEEALYLSLINKRSESSTELEEKTKAIAAEENDIRRIRKDLDEVKVLLQREKQTRHTLDVLGELDNVTGASKFVEFISTSQLKYIAVEASKRLSDITRGRYALELDSNGEFVMRDDYNGGMRRSVDTLSGGETFLTSLSLALALSSHIQLKGKAPIEFFFLDEGFGTLDNELLETVMSSLERLHSDRLCVGIISHVEEIKNRVPVKLIVSPAVPGVGGTRVEIEYS